MDGAAAVKDPVDLRSHSGIGGFVSLWTSADQV